MGMPQVTVKGYSTWEVVSAMQKEIRRGREREALFWCLELAESGLLPLAVNRLRVIALEDIGMADPAAVAFAGLCLDQAMAWKKIDNEAWYLALADAVLALSRAQKSRIGDSFQAAVRFMRQSGKLAVPDYALDMHTARGKAMGRGIEHFLEEGAQLANEDKTLFDRYRGDAIRFWQAGKEDQEPPTAGCERGKA